MLKIKNKEALFFVYFLGLTFSTVISYSSSTSHLELNRLWLNYCRELKCAQTLVKCLDEINCSGVKQCKRCVLDIASNEDSGSDCSKCINDIFDDESIDEINGIKYLLLIQIYKI